MARDTRKVIRDTLARINARYNAEATVTVGKLMAEVEGDLIWALDLAGVPQTPGRKTGKGQPNATGNPE